MTETIINLLDELDLDIQGFEDTPRGSLLFPFGLYDHSDASTSTLDVAPVEADLPPFELLEEVELEPRKWVAAGPPTWDDAPRAIATDEPLCRDLSIDVSPRSPSRSAALPLKKENLPSPTDRSFARLRDRGSILALRALNSALASPEISHRLLI